jgi:predicted ATP-grasp superfamily ATP-dependent carboligase
VTHRREFTPSQSTPPMRALVTDVHLRNAVAGLRALGLAGVPVLAMGPARTAAGLWSRRRDVAAVGPDVLEDPQAFVRRIAALAETHGPLVVYPGREESIDALVAHADLLGERAALPYPRPEGLPALRDKRALAELGASAGLSAPRTLALGTAEELRSFRPEAPVLLKPAAPASHLGTAKVARSSEELTALLDDLPPDDEVFIQERVPGQLLSLELVVGHDGTAAARFQQRVLRTWPAEAGGVAAAVSVPVDEELAARATRMLTCHGYAGLVQLQLVDGPDGPRLVDLNPRFYGPLPLSLACGVNLPAAWHAVVLGQDSPTPQPYKTGLGYRRLQADLVAGVRGYPRRLLARPPSLAAGAMWSREDPVPSVLLSAREVGIRLGPRLLRIRDVAGSARR